MDYLEAQQTSFPDLSAHFNELGDLWKKKLWDAMARKLTECTTMQHFLQPPQLIRLYEQFVKRFEKKLNPIRLVKFASAAAGQVTGTSESLAFLEGFTKTVEEDKQASVLLRMEITQRKLVAGRIDETKAALAECKATMDSFEGIMDAPVYSSYHQACALFHKAKKNAQEFFNHSILYLTYTPLATIPLQQQIALASAVGEAALLGENTYNFGELLQHPIIKALNGTQYEWLSNLLFAFNAGDLAKFNAILKQEGKQEVLSNKSNVTFLNLKIRIMAFMDMVFRKDANERTISFKEVASFCDVKEGEVELLLLKAFSLKVVKGLIDQVDQTVRIKWVQPRVLDVKQIASIRDRLKTWAGKVHETAIYLEASAPELIKPVST